MSTKIEELKADISEFRKLLDTASRPKVKDVLSIELRKLETSLISLKEGADQRPAPVAVSKPSNVPKVNPIEKIRDYAWDQSDKFVKFYLTVPGVQDLDPNSVTLSITENSCALCVSFPEKTRSFTIDNLLNTITPEGSYHKVKTDRVGIFLKKEKKETWSFITKTEKKIKEARDNEFTPKDSADPADGLMGIMKKLYQEGDDNMKRTIAKAWTQSRDGGASSTMDTDPSFP